MPVGEVGRERALEGLFVTEGAIKSFVERKAPAFDQGSQLGERRHRLDRISKGLSAATERAEAYRDALHVAEHGSDARAGGWEALRQRVASSGKALGQDERSPHGAAAHLVERPRGHPLHLIEDASSCQNMMLGIDRIARIACLMERRLDD